MSSEGKPTLLNVNWEQIFAGQVKIEKRSLKLISQTFFANLNECFVSYTK